MVQYSLHFSSFSFDIFGLNQYVNEVLEAHVDDLTERWIHLKERCVFIPQTDINSLMKGQ